MVGVGGRSCWLGSAHKARVCGKVPRRFAGVVATGNRGVCVVASPRASRYHCYEKNLMHTAGHCSIYILNRRRFIPSKLHLGDTKVSGEVVEILGCENARRGTSTDSYNAMFYAEKLPLRY